MTKWRNDLKIETLKNKRIKNEWMNDGITKWITELSE